MFLFEYGASCFGTVHHTFQNKQTME